MKKYLAFIKLSFLRTFTTRSITILWSINALLNFTLMMILWASSESSVMINYTKEELIGYYFLSFLVSDIIGWYSFWGIKNDIERGTISQFFVKPVSFFKRTFAIEIGYKSITIAIRIIIFFLIYFFLKNSIIIPTTLTQIIIAVPIIILGIITIFLIQYILGCCTLITPETSFLGDLFWMIQSVFGGLLFPLAFLGEKVQKILFFINPFKSSLSFPLEIIMGKSNTLDYVLGIVSLIMWIGILTLIKNYIWKKGLRKYSSFGQ